ncbi:hypothetical protein Agabi119p4_3734 [Agaricus bisporus var. burnettii]|uniref:Nephrocystin 3-like N-terminal domain-containing protein n=1 Tax=Agaricus bisporus var. burnettii TaxID=192524 RepID=A0A8H7F5D6_AGABI|nr:hypothetical protein Agabi119p4_3734 [Agaricus bisporus var. burnettii]
MILEQWFSRRFLPKSKQDRKDKTTMDSVPETRSEDVGNGFLAHARNFTINGAIMGEHQQIIQTMYNTITTGTTALDRLLPYTCPDAAVDSSARDPPPRCHPGTRQRILDTLNAWLVDYLWKIFWLSGPAGTGKSAVAQTLAEMCLEQGRLGAAYFFSRSTGRNNPRTVIPSLAYQLAVNVPDYGNLLGHAIAFDPSIFQKTPRVQLRRLIVEPFTLLRAQGHKSTQTPLLIILDGLDECDGIQAQCEIVEMVGEIVRLKKDLPLLWLIASRPEPHLQYIFSRADFAIDCKKEFLIIDADTRNDVDRYLRDSLIDIRTRFPLVTDAAWPSEAQSRRLEDFASGLFALAATIVRYVSDITYGDPVRRLTDFLAFMTNANHVTTTNPLQTLDLLYSQILSEIPENVYPVTRRILSFYQLLTKKLLSIQRICNFLCIDKHEFYNALNKLHALFDIPPPDRAARANLRVHHTSFYDYLHSSFRSGRFHIDLRGLVVDYMKTTLFWYKNIVEDPCYISDGSFMVVAQSATLSGLKWASNDSEEDLTASQAILLTVHAGTWSYFMALSDDDPDLKETLNQLEDLDFRYMLVSKDDNGKFAKFTEWLFSRGPHNTLLHTEPQDELEVTLLNKVVREVGRRMEPVTLPMVKMNISL